MKMIEIVKFMEVCKKSQTELKAWLSEWIKKYYDDIVNEDGFLYAKGNDKVLLTAHMDTVHERQCKYIKSRKKNGKTILSSIDGIGGDDRCGIWIIMQIVEKTTLRPSILFCEDEEIGGVGSSKFLDRYYGDEMYDNLFFIELDRANATDLVYYSDENTEFHEFCEKVTGYEENFGSFSDISHLCPAYEISGVNISCGYYKAHTTDEYVVWEEMCNSIDATINLITAGLEQGKQYEYVKASYYYGRKYNWFDEYFENYGKEESVYGDEQVCGDNTHVFEFYSADGIVYRIYAGGFDEAVGKLMTSYPNMCWNDIIDYDEYKD